MALLRLKMARDSDGRSLFEAEANRLLREYNKLSASLKDQAQLLGKIDEDAEKVAMHARMRELEILIESLVAQLGQDPGNEEIQEQLAAAQAEFDSISAELGGDRPAAQQDGPPPRGVTPPPVGGDGSCQGSLAIFSTSQNQRIPASGTRGTITSTIEVSGVGPYLLDLNLTTFITHTFNADLDITLMSPAGTIVTITTDNGGSNDNVFNGTVWDDQANPGGQVPYSSNAGLVTDHPYSNNVLASPLVPEEAMGAFIGEDPNGTWTLTTHDDSFGSTGTLGSWGLNVTTLPVPPVADTNTFSNETPASVANTCIQPDAASTIAVAGIGTQIGALKLTTNINHPNPADLDITLTSPGGTVVTITTDNGPLPFLANDAFDGTMWFDKANPDGQVPYPVFIIFPFNQGLATDRIYSGNGLAEELVPEEALSAFNGEDPNGTWTLTVRDDSCNFLVGTLSSWSLEITTIECCIVTCPEPITVGNDEGECGATVEFAPTDNGACGEVVCAPASGSFFPVGTTTVVCTAEAGPSCGFTVTVNDVDDPAITCPGDIIAITAKPGDACVPVSFTVTATDNCPGVTVACVDQNGNPVMSGDCIPATTTCTTVVCTATDAAGNTASCSFTVSVYDVFLEDDGNPGTRELVWNSFTGDYIFCCDGLALCGTGAPRKKGATYTLQHFAFDRRINATVSSATRRGTGSLQFTSGGDACSIEDRNTANNFFDCASAATCSCNGASPSAARK